MQVHHIGYKVKNIEESKILFQVLGYSLGEETVDADLRIKLCTLYNCGNMVELVEFIDNNSLDETPIGPYHICYQVESINDSIFILKQNGFRVINSAFTSKIFFGYLCVFLYHKDIGLLELIEVG